MLTELYAMGCERWPVLKINTNKGGGDGKSNRLGVPALCGEHGRPWWRCISTRSSHDYPAVVRASSRRVRDTFVSRSVTNMTYLTKPVSLVKLLKISNSTHTSALLDYFRHMPPKLLKPFVYLSDVDFSLTESVFHSGLG